MIYYGCMHEIFATRNNSEYIVLVLFKYDLDRSTTHPTFHPTEVRVHDLQIIDRPFHVRELPEPLSQQNL